MIDIILLLFPSVPGSLKASEPLSKEQHCCSQAHRKHQIINPASFELTCTNNFEIYQNHWNKLYTHNTKNLCNYNSITTVCINSSWVRAISFIQMACTGRGYGGEQLAIRKQLPLLLYPQCHRPPGTQPVINSCASGMFVCGVCQYRQQEFYFKGGHHL